MTVALETTIHTRKLPNGMTLVFESMPWLRSLSMAFLLPVGSATDPPGQEGSATVLFDWLGRGAGSLGSREFSDLLDGLGVRQGGAAGRETTSLSASMLASALPDALPLLADMLRRPRLDDAEFGSARELALQELASIEDSPGQRLNELLIARYFTSSHGRSAYGSLEGLQALDANAVREDYRRRYGPSGVVVAAAGGVDWEEFSSLVESHFGNWTGPGADSPAVAVAEPERHHEETESSQVQIGMAYPALPPRHQDWYHQTLAMSVLSGGTGSRLFMEVREKRGLVYGVHASTRALRDHGYVVARAGTTPGRADETLEVMQAEIARLGEGVEESELERARTGILSQLVMQGESSGARAAALAHDVYLRGEPRTLATVKSEISAVGLDDINDYLARQEPPRPMIVTLGPAAAAGD